MESIKQATIETMESMNTEEKKKYLIDTLNKSINQEALLCADVAKEMEELWQQVSTSSGDTTQLDINLQHQFEQGLRSFKKEVERFSIQKVGKEKKEAVLEKMESLRGNDQFKELSGKLRTLKFEWEDLPYAGPNYDSKLNRQFKQTFDELEGAKDTYFDELQSNRAKAKQEKQQLISMAKEAAQSTKWKQTSIVMKDLMTKWKEVGQAAREDNDALWEEFQGARQEFYNKQETFFEEKRKQQDASASKKEVLIEEAKSIALNDNIKETSQQMRGLMDQWKGAGSCDRPREEALWTQFSEARDVFFKRQNEFYELKRGKYMETLYEGIKRRNAQLSTLEKQATELEKEVAALRSIDPGMGNQENRWELANERNGQISKYQESIKECYIKIETIQVELKDMNKKYEELSEK